LLRKVCRIKERHLLDFRKTISERFPAAVRLQMANPDRVGAAYHEAGHAVILWAFGLQVDSTAIGFGGDDAAGHTKVTGIRRTPLGI
jgi:hypothetical protein